MTELCRLCNMDKVENLNHLLSVCPQLNRARGEEWNFPQMLILRRVRVLYPGINEDNRVGIVH